MNPPSDSNRSIAYYDENAEDYVRSTLSVDVSDLYEPFLGLVPVGGHILDAGCGSGRDTRYFLEHGYRVMAFDASKEMARLASEITGLTVSVRRLEEPLEADTFDGIWACASLLHVRRTDLPDVILSMEKSLKPGGVLYASFKLGAIDRAVGGRSFTNFTPETLRQLFQECSMLDVVSLWQTIDRRPTHPNETWVNLLARRAEARG